ncbi:MAG: GGDEF domain-containing protein, partial [Myxococcales bacterium]|nr:GGDEF domain-containing protein [Myxococcales bacterium]
MDEPDGRRLDSDLAIDSWRVAVRHAPYGVMVTDRDGTIVWVNDAVCQISGYSELELIGNNPRILRSGRHTIEFYERMFARLEKERVFVGEIWNRRKDGTLYAQSIVISRIDQGEQSYYVAQFHDVSALIEAERRATTAEERLGRVFESIRDGVFEWVAGSAQLTVSGRFLELLGTPEDATQHSIALESWLGAVVRNDRDHFRERLERCVSDLESHCAMTVRVLDARGELRYWYVRGAAIVREEVVVLCGAVTDVTEEELIRRRFEYESLYDPLTGLPNRSSFRERLLHCIDAWRRQPEASTFAVAILALDQYHMVVEGIGHDAADRLIVGVAGRLQTALSEQGATLAQLEQAHFALLVDGLSSATVVHERVNRIRKLMGEPFAINGREVYASLSIGVALPDHKEV